MFPKHLRNIKRLYYSLIFSKGKKFRGRFGSFFVFHKKDSNIEVPLKFGVVVSKKFGGAVQRNAFRRKYYSVLQDLYKKYSIESDKISNIVRQGSCCYIVYTPFIGINSENFINISKEISIQLNEIYSPSNN